jgi:hypothetical protein
MQSQAMPGQAHPHIHQRQDLVPAYRAVEIDLNVGKPEQIESQLETKAALLQQ